ncbi:class I SAM-dependent RNA methyltransferase [Propionicimonas sp.]|uniref:class I SAM-dependent RNA methyltransferase n=1 Tax=Propionicimonas sp. TaxID=1955623 RepID=UPI0039E3FA74
MLEPGDVLERVEIGPVAHGGHFIARHEGQVLFVRHAITGESVDVRITEVGRRFARADAVAIRSASEHRVEPPCAVAGRCGGCDFQHVEPAFSRELKRRVVAELLGHLAGVEFTGEVEEVQPSPLGWRRRMRYHRDPRGRAGLRAHRSAEVVALPTSGCLIADPGIARPAAGRPAAGDLLAVAAESGALLLDPPDRRTVTEQVGAHSFEVAAAGFWQPHRHAPEVLTTRVRDGLAPQPGETALDLFCGVGLFAASLADAGAHVWGIEGDRRAVELARRNVPSARFSSGDVLARMDRVPDRADVVVLDPPRTGAGAPVIAAVAARRPRAIAYVACDPAALGRDLATASGLGYRTVAVNAYDLFPLTHHVECVAILEAR